jgi:hypothetical protein
MATAPTTAQLQTALDAANLQIKNLNTNVNDLITTVSKQTVAIANLNIAGQNNTTTATAAVDPTPASPADLKIDNPENVYRSVKIATSNLFINITPQFSGGVPYLYFEDLSTTELASVVPQISLSNTNISSNDIISNISSIADKFSSYTLSKIPNLTNYAGFQLSRYVPLVGNGTGGKSVYFDTNNEYIIIETVNINSQELVQYEVLSQSNVVDATI